MTAKAILVICAQALLVKTAFSQCIGRAGIGAGIGPGIAPGLANGLASGLAPGLAGPWGAPGCGCGGVASTGGGFPVNSFSPRAPTGLSVVSENAIEGVLAVGGEVPFLGTVALEGILPTSGAGAISYGCGNGGIGITSEGPIATGITTPGAYPPGAPGPAYGAIAGPAFGAGIAGPGFGPGIAGPGFGPAGLAAGPYGAGLGYNGFGGIGCGIL